MRTLALLIALLFSTFEAHAQEHSDEPKIGVDVAPARVLVGRQVVVTFQIEAQEGVKVYFPEHPMTYPLKLLSHEKQVPPLLGSGYVETHRLVLLPLRLGTTVLKSIEVPYINRAGEPRIARTPEIQIEVSGTLGDEPNPQPAPAGEFVAVYVPNLLLIWTMAGAGIATVAGVSGALAYRAWRRWKEAHRPPPPPKPPLEVALEKLALLDGEKLVEAGEFQQLALQLSEIVREFLGATFGFPGIDLTTFEVIQALRNKHLGRVTLPEIEDFLSLCDLVKFAKWLPTKEEALGLVPRAKTIVERVANRNQGGVP